METYTKLKRNMSSQVNGLNVVILVFVFESPKVKKNIFFVFLNLFVFRQKENSP